MKKSNILFVIIMLFVPFLGYAQWSTGTGIVYTTDNVGVGTSSPSAAFEIRKTNTLAKLNITGSTTAGLITTSIESKYAGASNFGTFFNTSQGSLFFSLGSTTVMTLKSGKVGIGTTSPSVGLEIYKNDATAALEITRTGSIAGTLVSKIESAYKGASSFGSLYTTSQGGHHFYTGSSKKMGLSSNGDLSVTRNVTCVDLIETSDIRKKSNIAEDNLSHKDLYNLKTYRYTLNEDDTQRERIGLMAQELQEFYPELVYGDDENGYGVSYTKLVPLLIRALQDQNQTITALQDEVSNLKTKDLSLSGLQSKFDVYPNPASNVLKVSLLKSGDVDSKVDIINLNGEIVHSESLSNKSSLELSTSALSNGVYFIKYTTEGFTETKRIIVENK